MIKIEKTEIHNFEGAIRGMRNAKNSWDKADSRSLFVEEDNAIEAIMDFLEDTPAFTEAEMVAKCEYLQENAILNKDDPCTLKNMFLLGPNDARLAEVLANAGTDHGKFLRQIFISVDITAPIFWWKEFDTYKVGTVANSTSTMHTITNSPISMDKFSFDFLVPGAEAEDALCDMVTLITICEKYRKLYLEHKDTDKARAANYWRALIEFLPCGWLQTRTITMSYAN
jgi:hypothetical protein